MTLTQDTKKVQEMPESDQPTEQPTNTGDHRETVETEENGKGYTRESGLGENSDD